MSPSSEGIIASGCPWLPGKLIPVKVLTDPSPGQVCAGAVYVVAAPAAPLSGLLCIHLSAARGKKPHRGGGAFVNTGPGAEGSGASFFGGLRSSL